MIRLDPGLAFGNRRHVTTPELRQIVARGGPLRRPLRARPRHRHRRLAMTAALCGAERVLALDIDPVALRVVRENLEQNGLTGRVELQQGVLTRRRS